MVSHLLLKITQWLKEITTAMSNYFTPLTVNIVLCSFYKFLTKYLLVNNDYVAFIFTHILEAPLTYAKLIL